MAERPILDKQLDSKTFRDFYYLKEELVTFCREKNLPTSGGKLEHSLGRASENLFLLTLPFKNG